MGPKGRRREFIGADALFEASGDISDEMRAKFSDLALSIFTRSTPKDRA